MSIEFEKQINAVLKEEWNHRNALIVRSDTPEILQEAGLADLPMLCTGRHILAALGDTTAAEGVHVHNVSPEVMASLPELLEKPVLIADSEGRPDSIVVMTGAKDTHGRPVVVTVSTGGRGTLEGKPTPCNFITSVYGMDSYDNRIVRNIAQSYVLYADKNALSEYIDREYLDRKLPGEDKLHVRGSHNVHSFDVTLEDAPARYFIDMDGTLAQFHAEEDYLERMTEPHFFENLRPYEDMLAKLKSYIAAHPDSEFYILSGLTADAPDCEGQKNRWLDKHLPEIDAAHRIFTANGDDKSLYIPGGIRPKDILIDDYNKNLEDWQIAGGLSVKFVNQINDKALRGTLWNGERIHYNRPSDVPGVLGRLSANLSSRDKLKIELEKTVAEMVQNYRADPEKIAEFLEFASRFNGYSTRNMRLIMAQRPDAMFIASGRSYLAGLPDMDGNKLFEDPIYIKKGEKALYIWKPTYRDQVQIDGVWRSVKELTAKERALMKTGTLPTRRTTDFILVPVFDAKQTTMTPDQYPALLGFGAPSQSADDMFAALSAYSKAFLKCPVEVTDLPGLALHGAYYPKLNCIKISNMLSGDEKLSTLIHEIGHASLHTDMAANAGKSESQIELEADMYSLMVQQHLKLPITDSHKSHLADHYNRWFNGLSEKEQANINADLPVFDSVCKRYNSTIGTIDTYAERYAAYLRAEAEKEAILQAENTAPEVSTFEIYQVKSGEEMRDYRFEAYESLRAAGLSVDREHYELVYSASLSENETLESLYTRFNTDRPKDFTGHSLSVSDVVVLHRDGQDTAHYVDSVGYRDIPDFLPRQQLTSAQDVTSAPIEKAPEVPQAAQPDQTPDTPKKKWNISI